MDASAIKVNFGERGRSAQNDGKHDSQNRASTQRGTEPLVDLAQRMGLHGYGLSVEGLAEELASMSMARRQSALRSLQRTRGNRFVQRLAIQAKLTIGAAGDKYEQEADRVADQVMRRIESPEHVQRKVDEEEDEIQAKPLAASITPLVQRTATATPLSQKPDECEEEIQTKQISVAESFEAGTDFESRLSSTRGSGSPLPDSVRGQMEEGFGADFSSVRVHTGGEAAQLNRAVNAQAFTHGQDIYLGEGKGNLESDEGQKLLAHELTHVVQQSYRKPLVQRLTINNLAGWGHRWFTDVWLRGVNISPLIEEINKEIGGLGFIIGRGFQSYDPVIRPARNYVDITSELKRGGLSKDNALAFQHFLQNYRTLESLPRTLQEFALITCIAEVGRGYSWTPASLYDWMVDIVNGSSDWSDVKSRYTPSLTYKEDVKVDYLPEDVEMQEGD